MNIGNMPKLPDMPFFQMPDNIAPPTFDLAPPSFGNMNAPSPSDLDFDESSEYFYKPTFKSLDDYSSETLLRKEFKPLRKFNQKIDSNMFSPNTHNRFFVIRSNNIDDLHKVS